MASLRKKGNGFEIIFTDRSRSPYQVSLFFGPEFSDDIQSIKKGLEHDYRLYKIGKGGRDPWNIKKTPAPRTIRQAIKEYVKYKTQQAEDWSRNTERNYRPVFDKFIEEFGVVKTGQLQTTHLDQFINKPHLARATRKSYLRILKTFMKWANIEIDLPPIRGDKQRKQIKYILESEAQAVAETIMSETEKMIKQGRLGRDEKNSLWLINLLSWSFYAGTRPEETLLLSHDDYDRENKIVHIRKKTKTSTPRTLNIGKINILRSIMDTMTDPAYISERVARYGWNPDRIFGHTHRERTSRQVKKYIRLTFTDSPGRAEELTWYSYRHGCAVYLLSHGVPIYSVSKWLGHGSVSTTEKNYANIIDKSLEDHISQAHN